jgi:hypothetical protein
VDGVPDADVDSVVEAIAALRDAGYSADFEVEAGGLVRCAECGDLHPAEELTVGATYRFEGESDPDDEEVVFGLICGHCGQRGVLVSAYGPSASEDEAVVVTALHQTGTP